MRMRLLATVLIASLVSPGGAAAEESLRDARKQFELGVSQARQGDWAKAMGAFENAYRISKQPSALFNLASAQLRLGLMLEANANYHRFLLLRDPRIGAAHRSAVEKQLAHIEERIPRLRLHIQGLRPEDRVIVDKLRLYPPDLDLEQWLNPGLHVVTVYRQNGTSESHRITVLESEHKVLAISLP